MQSQAKIAADLRALDVRPGDVLMVHASLRRIGPVEGGAAGLVDAILAAAAPGGTMLMTLGAENAHSWVNEHPESERAALLADAVPFDPLTTPAQQDVGVLAEVFRTHPGTIVTDNPEGRFGANGARADELLRGAPWNDYYGPDSPLDRLCRMGGRILRLGADADTVTALHHAEYLADIPQKRTVRRHRRVLGPDGPEIRVVACLDDETGIADWPGDDYFTEILEAWLAAGKGISGTVGNARSELLDAADFVAFGARWMETHLGRAKGADA
jgi:aminoglycoside N3'-acetyltransferase